MGSHPEAYSEKIGLLLEYKENYEAIKACDYAIRKWPGNPEFLYMKGLTLADDGNYEGALELIDRALEINRDDQYEETRVQLLGRLGR